MARRSRLSHTNVHESFSDVALLMLATFIFLLVTIMISYKLANDEELPRVKAELEELKEKLSDSQDANQRLLESLETMSTMDVTKQMDKALDAVGLGRGMGKKDFDLFVQGLRDLPGEDLHLVVDATGSMHGVVTFLIPVLRVIVVRSGKRLAAITWFSDDNAETYTGNMGEMLDKLLQGAPFIGHRETIGDAFKHAAKIASPPGAYVLIGDEPSDDRIHYFSIPSPVFTLPIGKDDPDTNVEYQKLADKTGGRMMHLSFQ